MRSTLYYVWFAELSIAHRTKNALLDDAGGIEEVYLLDKERLHTIPYLTSKDKDALLEKSTKKAEAVLELCTKKRVEILTRDSALYPERLLEMPDAPMVLYCKGALPKLEETTVITVVGTRKASAYGCKMAKTIASDLAEAGVLVVSGMAEGIDGAANDGALRGGTATVAVLASGVDIIYPSFHRKLYERILADGVLLSEYPPEVKTSPLQFPVRNRIMAALCDGMLVVNAPKKSGALISARRALEYGKDLFVVPGNADLFDHVGSNTLIKEGAQCVTSASDILSYYNLSYDKTTVAVKAKPKAALQPNLTEEEQSVFTLIEDGMSTDELLELSPLPTGQTMGILTVLEVKGVVRVDKRLLYVI